MIANLDAVLFLERLPAESIDLICTDIAYESLEKHRAVGTTTRLVKQWFSIFPNARIPELFGQFYRVLRKNAHLYFFADSPTMFLCKPIGEAAGFTYWNEIVWDKMKMGMGYHWRRRHEFVMFFEKGRRKLNDLGLPDVLSVPRVSNPEWATEKPGELLRPMISNSTRAGEIVCDPFCGSGSTLVAAAMEGRRWIGNDLDPGAVVIANRRLDGLKDLAAVIDPARPAAQAVLF